MRHLSIRAASLAPIRVRAPAGCWGVATETFLAPTNTTAMRATTGRKRCHAGRARDASRSGRARERWVDSSGGESGLIDVPTAPALFGCFFEGQITEGQPLEQIAFEAVDVTRCASSSHHNVLKRNILKDRAVALICRKVDVAGAIWN